MATRDDRPDGGFRRADGLMPGVAASVVGYSAHDVGPSIERGLPAAELCCQTFVGSDVIDPHAQGNLWSFGSCRGEMAQPS